MILPAFFLLSVSVLLSVSCSKEGDSSGDGTMTVLMALYANNDPSGSATVATTSPAEPMPSWIRDRPFPAIILPRFYVRRSPHPTGTLTARTPGSAVTSRVIP